MKIYELGTPVKIGNPYFHKMDTYALYSGRYGVIIESNTDHAIVSIVNKNIKDKVLGHLTVFADETIIPLLKKQIQPEEIKENDFLLLITTNEEQVDIHSTFYISREPNEIFLADDKLLALYTLKEKVTIPELPTKFGTTILVGDQEFLRVSIAHWLEKEHYDFYTNQEILALLEKENTTWSLKK